MSNNSWMVDTTLCCENDREEAQKGEEKLWRAVITQTLMDAGSNSTKYEMRLIKAQAVSWLFGISQDFKNVCLLANLSPEYVRERAKEAIQNGCIWRAHNPNSYRKPTKNKKSLDVSRHVAYHRVIQQREEPVVAKV